MRDKADAELRELFAARGEFIGAMNSVEGLVEDVIREHFGVARDRNFVAVVLTRLTMTAKIEIVAHIVTERELGDRRFPVGDNQRREASTLVPLLRQLNDRRNQVAHSDLYRDTRPYFDAVREARRTGHQAPPDFDSSQLPLVAQRRTRTGDRTWDPRAELDHDQRQVPAALSGLLFLLIWMREEPAPGDTPNAR